jgi:hypothetical protein
VRFLIRDLRPVEGAVDVSADRPLTANPGEKTSVVPFGFASPRTLAFPLHFEPPGRPDGPPNGEAGPGPARRKRTAEAVASSPPPGRGLGPTSPPEAPRSLGTPGRAELYAALRRHQGRGKVTNVRPDLRGWRAATRVRELKQLYGFWPAGVDLSRVPGRNAVTGSAADRTLTLGTEAAPLVSVSTQVISVLKDFASALATAPGSGFAGLAVSSSGSAPWGFPSRCCG